MKSVIVALAAVSLFVSAAEVETLYSWENDAQKWKGVSGFSKTGATEGEHAAVRPVPTGWNNEMQSGYSADLLAKLAGKRFLAVDVTPSSPAPKGTQLKVTAQIIVQDDVNTGVELGGQAVAPGTTTLIWDYSAFAERIDAASGWAHLRLITEAYGYAEGQSPGEVYFDNLRVSKEKPAPVEAGKQ